MVEGAVLTLSSSLGDILERTAECSTEWVYPLKNPNQTTAALKQLGYGGGSAGAC